MQTIVAPSQMWRSYNSFAPSHQYAITTGSDKLPRNSTYDPDANLFNTHGNKILQITPTVFFSPWLFAFLLQNLGILLGRNSDPPPQQKPLISTECSPLVNPLLYFLLLNLLLILDWIQAQHSVITDDTINGIQTFLNTDGLVQNDCHVTPSHLGRSYNSFAPSHCYVKP